MSIPITVKKWRDTRPSSCKASNVGKACEDYLKTCLPIADLTTEADIAKAREAALELKRSLNDAKMKIKPADKEKEAIETLIKDWLTQITTYQGTLVPVVKVSVDAAAEQRRLAAEAEAAHYQTVLKGYGDRKNALLAYFKTEAAEFDRLIEDAKQSVAKADQLAKAAHAQPERAPQVVEFLGKFSVHLQPYLKTMAETNAEALKRLDPHRSGSGSESASSLGLHPADVASFKTIFTEADNLRKHMVEQAKTMDSYAASLASSLAEASVATLPEGERLPAYVKLATDLQAKVRTLTNRLSNPGVGMKSILDSGKEYKDKWDMYVDQVANAAPEKKDEMRSLMATRAQQRYDQVIEIEAGLKGTLLSAADMTKRGTLGIPEELRSDPQIKAQLEGARSALEEGKTYYIR